MIERINRSRSPECAVRLRDHALPRIDEQEARAAGGEDAGYYGTRLRGASNAKAKKVFGFAPRRLEWLRT